MTDEEDQRALRGIIHRRGAEFVRRELASLPTEPLRLTIVSNAGLHPIPTEYVRGRLYIASEGNLDFSNIESVHRELDEIVSGVKAVLFSERWTEVYLLPFGHSSISMAIKMAVFRLLRIETIDIFYFGGGRYDYLSRDSRESILKG